MGGKKTITKCQLQDTKLWWEVADTGRGEDISRTVLSLLRTKEKLWMFVRVCAAEWQNDSKNLWVFKWANRLYVSLCGKIESTSKEVNTHVTLHLPNNTKISDTSEPQSTQWHNAIQLSHFHVWHHVTVRSGLAHWVLVVPSCSLCHTGNGRTTTGVTRISW